MKVIGLHGKAGVGKDTLADIMAAEHGFVKRGFADPLYEEVAAAFGVTVEWLRDRTRKEVPQPELAFMLCMDRGFTDVATQHCRNMPAGAFGLPRSPRQVLQLWGTEYRRAQKETYWLGRMGAFMWQHEKCLPPGFVIPDVRFENEARWVIDHACGKIIHILRDVPGVAAHASEAGIPANLVSRLVDNNGPISLLHDVAIIAIRL